MTLEALEAKAFSPRWCTCSRYPSDLAAAPLFDPRLFLPMARLARPRAPVFWMGRLKPRGSPGDINRFWVQVLGAIKEWCGNSCIHCMSPENASCQMLLPANKNKNKHPIPVLKGIRYHSPIKSRVAHRQSLDLLPQKRVAEELSDFTCVTWS